MSALDSFKFKRRLFKLNSDGSPGLVVASWADRLLVFSQRTRASTPLFESIEASPKCGGLAIAFAKCSFSSSRTVGVPNCSSLDPCKYCSLLSTSSLLGVAGEDSVADEVAECNGIAALEFFADRICVTFSSDCSDAMSDGSGRDRQRPPMLCSSFVQIAFQYWSRLRVAAPQGHVAIAQLCTAPVPNVSQWHNERFTIAHSRH
mmetsp:Transcript_11205/g.30154  ORF Transcript_11205/g.30154 Transcript_11205/m.30154 type:complete len:204 (+) Transcript_11205:1664-2275(+)